jgi:hypothetical protein
MAERERGYVTGCATTRGTSVWLPWSGGWRSLPSLASQSPLPR